jgi:hypothetical protein
MQTRRLPHRVAFFSVAFMLLSIVALLPFALAGVIGQTVESASPTYKLMSGPQNQNVSHSHVNLQLTGLDEWQRTVAIMVAGHHICEGGCNWTDRLMFVSIPPVEEDGEGLPPFATVDFKATSLAITQSITLPIYGAPVRYPFDSYGLRVAVVLQRIYPDGTTQTFTPQDAPGHLFLSVNGFIPRAVMAKPVEVPLNQVFVDDPAYQYIYATQLTFSRPLYLQILAVFLVLLVSAASAYAVFLRPLNELVINAGALVLGVWGIRAILLGPDVPGFTIIDLSLMVVILFLLLAITWRALLFLHERSEIHLPRIHTTQPMEAPREPVAADGQQRRTRWRRW